MVKVLNVWTEDVTPGGDPTHMDWVEYETANGVNRTPIVLAEKLASWPLIQVAIQHWRDQQPTFKRKK